MKSLAFAIALSLVANGILAGWIVLDPSGSRRAEKQAAAAAKGRVGKSSPPTGAGASGAAAAKDVADPLKLSPEQWNRLLSGDLKQLVERLRAAKFPPEAIVAIVREQAGRAYEARFKALFGITEGVPSYWTNEGSFDSFFANNPKALAELQALATELEDQVRDLTGDDFYMAKFAPDSTWGDLPKYVSGEKALQLVKMGDELSRKINEIQARSLNGPLSPEDTQAIANLQKQRRAAVAALLTTEEYDQLVIQMNGSFFPAQVIGIVSGRNLIYPFEPTEDEFLAIYKARKAFVLQYPNDTPEEQQVRAQHQKDLQDQVAALLGPDRAEEYRTALLPGSAQVSRLVARLELPKTAVGATLGVQQDIQARATAVRSDNSLTPAARTEQLAALASEANQRLVATLGQKGLDAYKQTGGAWLNNLVPAQRPAAPAPRPNP